MALSVFDLFKIGIGPSSSHTVGPMRAARQFALRLRERGVLGRVARVTVTLYGSLGATGKGHGSDKAVLLGLSGHEPDTVDVDAIAGIVGGIRTRGQLTLSGEQAIAFNERADLTFNHKDTLPLHSNGMQFTAFDADGAELAAGVFYSVGGGFVVSDEPRDKDNPGGGTEKRIVPDLTKLPFPFRSGDELLALCEREKTSIAGIMRRNERAWRSDADIDAGLLRIWHVMQACVKRGCETSGVLPGGLQPCTLTAPSDCAAAPRSNGAPLPLGVLDGGSVGCCGVGSAGGSGNRLGSWTLPTATLVAGMVGASGWEG